MGKLTIECDTGKVSDGYHTFDELYEHRCVLFIALMKKWGHAAWKSKKHNDGTMFDGWFIGGIQLPFGQITYHLPEDMWPLTVDIQERSVAPEFDGHTPQDVLDRLKKTLM